MLSNQILEDHLLITIVRVKKRNGVIPPPGENFNCCVLSNNRNLEMVAKRRFARVERYLREYSRNRALLKRIFKKK